jgi:DNA polymerase I
LYLAMVQEGLPLNAYHWGEYAKAQTVMELEGLPVARAKYECIRENKEQLQHDAIDQLLVDPRYAGVYQMYSFNLKGFEDLLNREGIAWPRLSSGQLDVREETIKAGAEIEPALVPIHETRKVLSALRGLKEDLSADDCLRCYTSPFHTATGRNNPSSKVFIPAMPRAFRQLLQPPKDEALLYLDFGQQEILIGAALSGDKNLLATYSAKDPYVKFGHDSGVLKPHETKETAPAKRDACKVFMLAVGYGMQTQTLAKKINADVPGMHMSEYEASELIYKHKRLYEVYWNWVGAYVEEALINGVAYTASGWAMHVMPKRNSKHPQRAPEINLRAIGNFPVQGTGSDILRVACINLVRAGIRLAAPVHDAVFVRCKLSQVEWVRETATQIMINSAEEVLQCGVPIRVDCQVIAYPDHYPVDLEGKNGKKPASGAKLWLLIQEKYFRARGL